ncbi:helix-turn-helix domain-containing protein [Metabacillus sp. FJAT-52054]|uniref:Helix-turn-helix domain-containing protein n=1 Tax=Metabacillus sediminis TaxID=3117746 RepID=A0ABZ2NJ96_9BACI
MTLKKLTEEEIFLKVYKSFYTSGLASKIGKELGRGKVNTLLAIASYMDDKGICFPTQEQLADRTGTTIGTINRDVNELLDFRIDGKPILIRRKHKTNAGHRNSIYRVMPISQLSIFDREIEPIQKPLIEKDKEASEREAALADLLAEL